MHLTPTISLLEVVWVLVALVTLGFNLWGATDAIGDLAALYARRENGSRELIARKRRRNEYQRAVTMLIFLTIGVAAMSVGTRPDAAADPDLNIPGIVTGLGLIVVEVTMLVGSILDRIDRTRALAVPERRRRSTDVQEGTHD